MNDQTPSIGLSIDRFMRTEASGREAKKAAHKFTKKYGIVLDNFSDVMFIVDKAGHFVFVNKASEERTGIPTEKFIGRHFLELIDLLIGISGCETYKRSRIDVRRGHAYPCHCGIEGIWVAADPYDSLRSNSAYRNAMGHEKASAKIHKCGGTHFDPDLVRTFLEALKEKEEFFRGTNYHPGGYQKAS